MLQSINYRLINQYIKLTKNLTTNKTGMNNTSCAKWHICEELTTRLSETNYALIVLNTPINFSFNPQFVINLWNNAKVRVTVDGGTERWLNWLTLNECEFPNIVGPDLITGDMDSLSKEVLAYFQNQNANVVFTPDQNETDFTKALRQLKKYIGTQSIEINKIFVLADTCGRFDQIMANIHTLHKAKSIVQDVKVIQIASTSLTWLLDKGKHAISIPLNIRKNKEWCALIPIGGPCTVTTTGLQWNLEHGKLEFGHLVSTSNTYSGTTCVVTIETDSPVIWSMGIDNLF